MILSSQEKKNPYDITIHIEHCPEEAWEDREAGLLISADEVADRGCDACAFEWSLWTRIIEDTGDAIWGEIAEQMLELDEYVETFNPPPTEITAAEWSFLRAVRHERMRRQAYLTWQADRQEAK